MSSATENLLAALGRAAELRPAVGGFPVLAEVLRQAGVLTNEWLLPSACSIYTTVRGTVVQQDAPLTEGVSEVAAFDRGAVLAAIRADQAGETSMSKFLTLIWRAGVMRFVVDLEERSVTYHGTEDARYVEAYPAVVLPATMPS